MSAAGRVQVHWYHPPLPMTLPAPTYDLVLLLDPEGEEGARTKILADTRATIEAQGELLRHDEWGARALTYPIDRKTTAEYHLLQFHAGAPELLGGLDRTLRITDGVMRFRIVKLAPGVPDAPDAHAVRRVEEPVTDVAVDEPAAEVAVGEPV
jgi:small subunit ribosomal protein S6